MTSARSSYAAILDEAAFVRLLAGGPGALAAAGGEATEEDA